MNNNQQTTFIGGLTVLGLGLGIGALLGVLYAPAEGKKTRLFLAKKMEEWIKTVEESEQYAAVKRIFGDVSQYTVDLYDRIQEEVIKNVEEARITVGSIDRQAYYAAVEKAIMTFSSELQHANARTMALRAQLKAEGEKLPEKAPAPKKIVAAKPKAAPKAAPKTAEKPEPKKAA